MLEVIFYVSYVFQGIKKLFWVEVFQWQNCGNNDFVIVMSLFVIFDFLQFFGIVNIVGKFQFNLLFVVLFLVRCYYVIMLDNFYIKIIK